MDGDPPQGDRIRLIGRLFFISPRRNLASWRVANEFFPYLRGLENDQDHLHKAFHDNRLLVKVPQVTAFFWIIKILCTTVGETFADFLSPYFFSIEGKSASRLPDELTGMTQQYRKLSTHLVLRTGAVVPLVTRFPASKT